MFARLIHRRNRNGKRNIYRVVSLPLQTRYSSSRTAHQQLSNRIAVITGAGSGIGRATAKLFAKHKCVVNCIDIHEGNLLSLQREIDSDLCNIYIGDASNEQFVGAYMNAIFDKYAAIHILCNIAGHEGKDAAKPFHLHTQENIEQLLQTNLMNTIINCKLCIPRMLQTIEAHKDEAEHGDAHEHCSIINTTSDVTSQVVCGMSTYTMSKYAVLGLSKCIAAEYGASRIRCNVVQPGRTNTALLQRVLGLRGATQSKSESAPEPEMSTDHETAVSVGSVAPVAAEAKPLFRDCTAEEIAQLYLWFASDASVQCNGSEFRMDSGLTLSGNHYPSMLYENQSKLL